MSAYVAFSRRGLRGLAVDLHPDESYVPMDAEHYNDAGSSSGGSSSGSSSSSSSSTKKKTTTTKSSSSSSSSSTPTYPTGGYSTAPWEEPEKKKSGWPWFLLLAGLVVSMS